MAQKLAKSVMNLQSVDSPLLPVDLQTSSVSPQWVSGGPHNECQSQVPGVPESSLHCTMELPPIPAIVDALKRVKGKRRFEIVLILN